jgi:hypothetical protein
MESFKKALTYGFLIWILVFIVGFLIFPIHDSHRPLFESIMPVAISITTVFFSLRYFRLVKRDFVNEGLNLGLVFLGVNLIIDLILFLSPSPMQMSFINYIQDIGVTYLMIPAITIGFGYLAEQRK